MAGCQSTRAHVGLRGVPGQSGQASLLVLGVVAVLLAGLVVLFAFGLALGARGKQQRAADLAAVSAAQVMRRNYSRLFEPPLLPSGVPNPRHLSNAAYLALARAAARRGAVRNGLRVGGVSVSFPGVGFAPTRVTVRVRAEALVRAPGDERPRPVAVGARATAELAPDTAGLGAPSTAAGGGYAGPLAYRHRKAKIGPPSPGVRKIAAMIRFYWALTRRAPAALWGSTNHALGALGVLIFGLALFNREWSGEIAGWEGFSPWWVAVAIGVVFLYAMARANYEEVRHANTRADKQAETEAELRNREDQVRLLQEELTTWQKRYQVSQAQYEVLRGFDEEYRRG
jgi:Putative Flp pilus-assembly TadE/G-like